MVQTLGYCPPFGPKNAKIVVVGEAPGETEVRLGKPFVGRTGQKLRQWMRRAGIDPDACYWTNVFKHRPVNNNIETFFEKMDKGIVVPQFANVLDELEAELKGLNPNLILAVGRVALWAFRGTMAILTYRGSILPATRVAEGKKILPIIHPSAALKQFSTENKSDYIAVTQYDLEKAARQARFPEIRRPRRRYHIPLTLDGQLKWLRRLKGKKRLSVDIETLNGCIACIGFAWSETEAVCIPLIYKYRHLHAEDEAVLLWDAIADVLHDPSIEKVGQNLQFDYTYLLRHYRIHPVNVALDTMIAWHFLHIEWNKSLSFIASILTDEPYWKDDLKEWKAVQDWDRFFAYNCTDCCVTFEIARKIEAELAERPPHVRETYEVYHELTFGPLLFATLYGWKLDLARLNKYCAEVQDRYEHAVARLQQLLGRAINVNSSKQLKRLLYEEMKLPPYTKDGKVRVDRDALLMLKTRYPSEVLDALLKAKELAKLASTYTKLKWDPETLRFHAGFKPTGTVTGRLASGPASWGVGSNLQNLPRVATERAATGMDESVRHSFIADDGCLLAEFDLVQAEAAVVFWLAQEVEMIEAFMRGEDIHSLNAHFIFGKPYEWIKANKKTDAEAKQMRQLAKIISHGFHYQMGPMTIRSTLLRMGIDMPLQQCRELLASIRQRRPAILMWHREVQRELIEYRRLVTPLGLMREFGGRFSSTTLREALAFIPQSTVGMLGVIGWTRMYNEFGDQVTVLAGVHDSVVVQMPRDLGEDPNFLNELAKCFLVPMTIHGRQLVIPVECKVGPSWAEMEEVSLDVSSYSGAAKAVGLDGGVARDFRGV